MANVRRDSNGLPRGFPYEKATPVWSTNFPPLKTSPISEKMLFRQVVVFAVRGFAWLRDAQLVTSDGKTHPSTKTWKESILQSKATANCKVRLDLFDGMLSSGFEYQKPIVVGLSTGSSYVVGLGEVVQVVR